MSDAMKALDEIELLLKSAQTNTGRISGYEDAMNDIDCALSLLPTLRAALTPPADDPPDVDTVRRRHIRLGSQLGNRATGLTAFEGEVAHQDRATLLRAVDRLSAELAKEREWRGDGWQPIETAPVDEPFLATCRVKNINGDQWWETYRIVIDNDTGEIDTDIDQPWSLEDYEFWRPMPSPPATQHEDTP